MQQIDTARLQRAKPSFAVRRVPDSAMRTLIVDERRPRPGDLVLARIDHLGSHKRIELPTGRRAQLRSGSEVILAYGHRYAPDQYEAYVPERLGRCHLAAAGGIAGVVRSWHDRLDGPTAIDALAFLGDAHGRVLNLADFALPARPGGLPHAIAVFGTSMNAGKTSAAAALVAGLAAAGHRVAAAKVTGTAAGGDLWSLGDHGALAALDFTDAGFATTFGADIEALVAGTARLLRHLAAEVAAEIVVVEVADGLYQQETRALAGSPAFRALLEGTLFAAGDAMGAVAGATRLASLGHRVLGVAGALTRSPLAIREVEAALALPTLTLEDLAAPDVTRHLGFARAAAGTADIRSATA